jgi:hypothetical protein
VVANRREDIWLARAIEIIPTFVAERGAVIWPEVVANLAEGDWISTNLPAAGYRSLQPHILARARTELVEEGVLMPESVVLNHREITVYLDGPGLAARRTKEIRATAAAKRRLYRTYLSWTTTAPLCGHVAEQVVEATLRALAGTHIWLPPDFRRGQVSRLRGRDVPGGPLDAAGFIPHNAADPGAGLAAFAVEVKNLRGWLYPWSHEVWDLLAKLGEFPDVVPILVARRLHPTTFRMFKDVGAIGFDARNQWFAERAGASYIDPPTFERVRRTFGFDDALLLSRPPEPHRPLTRFFTTTLVQQPPVGDRPPLILAQGERWEEVAPIASHFTDLRAERMDGPDRRALLGEFAARLADAGLLDTRGWVRLPDEYYEEDDPDWEPDWDEV